MAVDFHSSSMLHYLRDGYSGEYIGITQHQVQLVFRNKELIHFLCHTSGNNIL